MNSGLRNLRKVVMGGYNRNNRINSFINSFIMKTIPTILFASIMCFVSGLASAADDDAAIKRRNEENPGNTIQTTRQGEQTEVKVTNRLGTYVVKPNQSVGTSLPGDAQSSSNHPAQWVVDSWGNKKPTKSAEPPETLPPNPNSPNK